VETVCQDRAGGGGGSEAGSLETDDREGRLVNDADARGIVLVAGLLPGGTRAPRDAGGAVGWCGAGGWAPGRGVSGVTGKAGGARALPGWIGSALETFLGQFSSSTAAPSQQMFRQRLRYIHRPGGNKLFGFCFLWLSPRFV
jgi:hypothetical protein